MILNRGRRQWVINCSFPEVQPIGGVGIGIGRKLALEMSHVHFHAFSERVCTLHATIFNVKFQFFSVYFPTSWEHDEVVEQVYDLLTVLISTCVREGATPIVAGDFNASIGRALPHDEIEFLGFLRMWTPECKRLVFDRLGAGQRIANPKPHGHNYEQRCKLDMPSFL